MWYATALDPRDSLIWFYEDLEEDVKYEHRKNTRRIEASVEEDEWKLIAIGGLLGLAVGVFQLVFVFSGAL